MLIGHKINFIENIVILIIDCNDYLESILNKVDFSL